MSPSQAHRHQNTINAGPLSSHAPNINDKPTVLSFARMSANAYYEGSNQTGWKWKDISEGFNYTLDFGWEEDGLRGHVFADGGNGSVVVALKGRGRDLKLGDESGYSVGV